MSGVVKKGGFLGSTFLVIAASAGGGFFELPVFTGIAGIYPSLILTLIVWLSLLATALLFVEALLHLPDGTHLISMSYVYFGRLGKVVGACIFTLFFFSVVISFYFVVPYAISFFAGRPFWGYLAICLIFGFIVYLGIKVADRINFILVAIFLVASFLFIALSGRESKVFEITSHNWNFIFLPIPILFTLFSFHFFIPTLVSYLGRDVKKIRRVIFWGTFIPFILYCLWELTVSRFYSKADLWLMVETKQVFTPSFRFHPSSMLLDQLGSIIFLFNYLITLIAFSLSFVDMLSDGMKIPVEERVGFKRFKVCCLVFIPPLLLITFLPSVAGVLYLFSEFGVFSLVSVIPLLFVWVSRYRLKSQVPHLVPGGKLMLIFLSVFICYLFLLQLVDLQLISLTL